MSEQLVHKISAKNRRQIAFDIAVAISLAVGIFTSLAGLV
jgi:hypothetical protein